MIKRLIPPLLLLLTLGLAGCASDTTVAPNEVHMGGDGFSQTAITVTAGDQVKFVDSPTSGGLHILYFGHNAKYAANPNGPTELNNPQGVTLKAGDTLSYTFATPGTYEVTCQIHPDMNVTITVN